jgi:hypothetical protein
MRGVRLRRSIERPQDLLPRGGDVQAAPARRGASARSIGSTS